MLLYPIQQVNTIIGWRTHSASKIIKTPNQATVYIYGSCAWRLTLFFPLSLGALVRSRQGLLISSGDDALRNLQEMVRTIFSVVGGRCAIDPPVRTVRGHY